MNNILNILLSKPIKLILNLIFGSMALIIIIGNVSSLLSPGIHCYTLPYRGLAYIIAILYFINNPHYLTGNKPNNTKVNKDDLEIAIKQYSIILYDMLLELAKELNNINLINNINIQRVTERKKSLICYCNNVIYEIERGIPAKKSEEEKDTSGIKRVIKGYINALEDNLKTMKEFTKGEDPVLLEVIQKTNIQLQKILEKDSYLDYTLRSDINKFIKSAKDTNEYIIGKYTD
ncbi:MAG: hypothetical protein AB7V50_02695 [Vampirovibrionia bacterium]